MLWLLIYQESFTTKSLLCYSHGQISSKIWLQLVREITYLFLEITIVIYKKRGYFTAKPEQFPDFSIQERSTRSLLQPLTCHIFSLFSPFYLLFLLFFPLFPTIFHILPLSATIPFAFKIELFFQGFMCIIV